MQFTGVIKGFSQRTMAIKSNTDSPDSEPVEQCYFGIEIVQEGGQSIYINTTDPRAPEVFRFGEVVEIEVHE